jgi:uncharacterized membrane protein
VVELYEAPERAIKGSPDFASIIGSLLRWGVVLSSSIIALGCALLFAEGETGYAGLATTAGLTDKFGGLPMGLPSVFEGVLALKPYAVIDLGLLILLATPILRVAVSIPLFALERRFAFVLITGTVLAILMLSILVIAPLASS